VPLLLVSISQGIEQRAGKYAVALVAFEGQRFRNWRLAFQQFKARKQMPPTREIPILPELQGNIAISPNIALAWFSETPDGAAGARTCRMLVA
jgi:hypothetical protein